MLVSVPKVMVLYPCRDAWGIAVRLLASRHKLSWRSREDQFFPNCWF